MALHLCAFAIVAGCDTRDAALPADEGSATFVGGDTCQGCHEAEFRAWQGSHHDRALDVADSAAVLGDFGEARITRDGVTHRFFTREGSYRVETTGPSGVLQEYPVTHVIGVEPLQQYLVPFPGGRLQTLPFAWDTRSREEGGQRWFHIYGSESIGPGDPLYWTGVQQNFNSQCAECHVTHLQKGYDPVEGAYDTRWAEGDVSCEACHGPGSRHVAAAEAAAARGRDYAAGGRDFPVVLSSGTSGSWGWSEVEGRPVRSAPAAATDQIDACGRCHSRRGLETPDYVHGTSLLDTHRPALPREPLYFADGQIRDEVYVWGSFLQSRMHRAGVVCTDCHDPHSATLRTPGASVCLGCHAATVYQGPQHDFHPDPARGGDVAGKPDPPTCLDCHMPERTYMGVDDRRDHSFRVPRPRVASEAGAPDPCTTCHAGESPRWAGDVLTGWYGTEGRHARPHYGEAFARAARRGPSWPQGLGAVLDDPETPALVRAAALEALSEAHPRHILPRILALAADPDPVIRRTAMEVSAILVPDDRVRVSGPGLSDPVRGVRTAAARALAGAGQLLPPERQTAFDAAREEWIGSQRAMAERASSHVNLGTLHAAEGRVGEAEASFLEALELDPANVAAWTNLADLYRATGREAAAMETLERGIASVSWGEVGDDRTAPLIHGRGLARVRAGRPEDALDDLGRAVRLAPGNPRFAYVFVVALLDLRGDEAALAALDTALERHPRDPELLGLGVSIHRRGGDSDRALALARRLLESDPGDPDYQAAVLQLGGRP